jgi:hypothetical protein
MTGALGLLKAGFGVVPDLEGDVLVDLFRRVDAREDFRLGRLAVREQREAKGEGQEQQAFHGGA